ncbi:hypothetical protein Tco_1431046 [Tanacetum coccineum]
MYAMTSTRPGITYAVGRLSRFTSNPMLEDYLDASWINHVCDSSSHEWMGVPLGVEVPYHGLPKKKHHAHHWSLYGIWFVALAAAGKEAEWLRNLIHEIPIWPKPIAPI